MYQLTLAGRASRLDVTDPNPDASAIGRSQAQAERHFGGEADVAARHRGDALQHAAQGSLPPAMAVLVHHEQHTVRLGVVAGRLDLQACRRPVMSGYGDPHSV